MRSTFGGIEIGKRGLMTQQRALDVTGHNVANANNKNYSRQRVIQSATPPYTMPSITNGSEAGQVGTGVYVRQIMRMRDLFIDQRLRYENHALGEWSIKKDNLIELEAIFNELGSGGLTASLNKFWDSFADLGNSEGELAYRQAVINNALALTDQLHYIDQTMVELRDNIGSEIEGKLAKVNDLTQQIADLNKLISTIESDVSKQANDLKDERDALLDQLTKIVDVSISFDDRSRANISLNGIGLVQGDMAHQIRIEMGAQTRTVEVDLNDDLTYDPISGDQEYTYIFDQYSFKVGNNSVEINSGEVRGLLDVRDEIIDLKVNRFDQIVRTIKNEVNNLHKSGYDKNGNTGIDFFIYDSSGNYEAGNLLVNPALVADPNMIAASTSPDPDDVSNVENALAISRLRTKAGTISSTTFEDFWLTQAGKLGLEIESAERMEVNQEVMVWQLSLKRQEVSGVSMDEEFSEMIKFQQGYNAAAKVLAKMDQMLDTLINGII